MEMPDLVATTGELTPDGRRLIDWIEAQFKEADATNDLARLNSLSGYLAYYYVNVHKLNAMTPARWLQEHQHSGAAAAWRDMQYLEETAKKQAVIEAAAGKTNELAARIDALQKALDEALAKIAALEAKPEPSVEAAPARKGKRQAVKETEPAPEAESEPDSEPEPEAKKDDPAGEDAPEQKAEASETEA